ARQLGQSEKHQRPRPLCARSETGKARPPAFPSDLRRPKPGLADLPNRHPASDQCIQGVLAIDDEGTFPADADRWSAHLVQIEDGEKMVGPRLSELSLRQRSDSQAAQREPFECPDFKDIGVVCYWEAGRKNIAGALNGGSMFYRLMYRMSS
ncbi:hypothetical protein LCGC14_1925650, partial [marine sediment metagenome]